MNNVYCTLFNVNYLDKGIVLYDSLEKVCSEFKLYVLAMDDTCYRVLESLSKTNLFLIKLADFENEDLLKAKKNRRFGEYCWTCSSSLISYVLEVFKEPICTYIDADMCFYEDPQVLIEEMLQRNAEVLVVGHRFNAFERKEREMISGKYCVEFNTFLNSERANALLKVWVNQCLDSCSSSVGNGSLGDQMYLTNWVENYDFVCETNNLGAGVAPWNIKQYKLLKNNDNSYSLSCNRNKCKLIFYHFENIEYKSKNLIKINVYDSWRIDKRFVSTLYKDYLSRIDVVKNMLETEYGVTCLIKKHPARPGGKPTLARRVKAIFRNIFDYKYLKHYFFSSFPRWLNKRYDIMRID